ncbi:MAG: hypothetical protein LJE96_23265 [Deltaproteobacteria bacterium]|nr:hypothetical protein [Deltaproteobacteria bacterium]
MGEDSKKKLVLDKEAQKLFDQLGGIDKRERGYASGGGGLSSDPLGEEQELLDLWRIVVADFVYVLGNFFYKIKLHGVKSVRAEDVAPIIDMLSKIHEMSERDARIMIRYRGMRMPNEKPDFERVDYVVTCDGFMVDIPIMKALANRKGLTMSHLPGKLKAAFDRFSSLDIHSICFTLGKWQQRDRDMMWTTLQAAGRFFCVYKTKIPPAGHEDGEEAYQVVYNEQGEPDPNLTLLAAANGRSIGYIQSLVHKLRELTTQPKGVDALAHYVSSYDALFAFKNVQQKLRKPPLEINNLRRLVISDDDETFTPAKSEVVRMIAQHLGGSPQELVQTIDSVYGNDFSLLSAGNLNARLARVSRLLDSSKRYSVSERAEKEVLNSVETRLRQVRDDVFEEITLHDVDTLGRDEKESSLGQILSQKLQGMVAYFKRRVLTKKKIRDMVRTPIDFDDQDYETIAREFDVSIEEAKAFLALLKGCFDPSANFVRGSFEKNIPHMAKYGVKVFGFLWHYLKETMSRRDRVAFLNSFQSLILEMQQSPAALVLLLEDFFRKPYEVVFSDRNALILANVLLRKYNKELHNDIEVTPEEVLLVREGLSPEARKAAGDAIDRQTDAFFQKIRTIHGKFLAALRTGEEKGGIPPRFLLSLERECFIFLALIGRPHGHAVLKSAVRTYGNPASEIYQAKAGKGFREACLRHLRVAVRGLSRYEDKKDLPLLMEIRKMERDFMAAGKDGAYRDSVKKAMEWLDIAIAILPA